MYIRDELNQTINFQIQALEIITILQHIKEKKEQDIEEIKNKINKYEQKKRAEQLFYQSLSPVRKFFASRPPIHHQAVEHMVHVKERLKQIEQVKQRMYELDYIIQQLKVDPSQKEVMLSSMIMEEIKIHRKTEDLKHDHRST